MNLPTAYNRLVRRFSLLTVFGLPLLGLAACGGSPQAAPSAAPNSGAPREQLSKIVDHYWEERVLLGSSVSPQAMADSLAVERRYLTDISAMPRASLDRSSQLTYDIFRNQREASAEGFTYPTELLAVDPFNGMPQQLARLAAQTEQPPAAGSREYENWLHRIDDYQSWTRLAIENMREGMRRGYLTPKPVIERALPSLERFGADTATNIFRLRLGASLDNAIKQRLLPSYRELHEFLQRDYMPHARVSLSLSALPLGRPWYAYLVRVHASTALTPNEIHILGMTEVERIRSRMAKVPATPPVPSAAAIASVAAPALLAAYADLKVQVLAGLPLLFADAAPGDFEIRAAQPLGEAIPSLFYRPAGADGSRGGILYVDLDVNSGRPAAVSIANFLREAIPGLEYQAAVQQARTDLPKFRRFGGTAAFVEGWGLYAASLGEELGLYRDEEARNGALWAELSCAAALVVDTGLHAKGWTRMQALDYLHTQLGMDDVDANLQIDRFVALPGEALACKIGELKIQALRNRAQQVLGTRFDIREFHSEILNDGAMPLDILEAKMKVWMDGHQ